jgi:D-threo-aldose 1-dehydrogenase
MKQAQLGSVETTSIGLGTAPLGGLFAPVSDLDADATIEQAWSLGVRFFDTAPLYGFGLAERHLGSLLRKQKRESFAISTKVGRPTDGASAEKDHYKSTPRVRPTFDFNHDGSVRWRRA